MVLCKDCKYCKLDTFFSFIPFNNSKYEFAKCTRDKKIDPVSGKEIVRSTYCSTSRDYSCGKEGKFFEAA